ncbi:MAG: hypothetical protein M1836_008189 [Candelina mexicana]|nr:MAG: hypothetical protein M1836_008189 [Candelina mexicana]
MTALVNSDGSPYIESATTLSSSTLPTTSTSSSTPTSTSTLPKTTSSITSPAASSTQLGSSTKVGLGVGLSLGIVCIILTAALLFLLRRERTKRREASTAEPVYGIEGAPGYGTEAERVARGGKE